jgi:Co/Zn/Cd efflux system component
MVVQMLYGIWTNSLGLISDGMWSESRFNHQLVNLTCLQLSTWGLIVWLLAWAY